MRVELTRFRVLPGRGGVVEEWMAHLDYWRRCIDPSFPPEDLTVRQHVVTAAVQDAIDDP